MPASISLNGPSGVDCSMNEKDDMFSKPWQPAVTFSGDEMLCWLEEQLSWNQWGAVRLPKLKATSNCPDKKREKNITLQGDFMKMVAKGERSKIQIKEMDFILS